MADISVAPMAVWDTNVIISAIQKTRDAKRDRWAEIEPFIGDAETGKFKIVVSELVVAELLNLNDLSKHNVSLENQYAMIEAFLEIEFCGEAAE